MPVHKNPIQKKKDIERPASGQDIRNILGRVDNTLIVDILHTGASQHDIMQARSWLDADDYMGGDLAGTMDARTRLVYEILLADRRTQDDDL